MAKTKKVVAISLKEASRRSGVSYPTCVKYKKLGSLNRFIVPGLETRILFKPGVVQELIKLRDEGYDRRGRPREVVIEPEGV